MKFALIILWCLVSTAAGATTESYTACGDTSLYGPQGVIMSPNHPEYYPYNLNCSHYIYASSGSSFSFIFTDTFNVEDGFDFVTMVCPTNSSFPPQPVSGWHGDRDLPSPVSMPWCSQGLVHFSSNDIMASSGFKLNYYVSDGGCGNTLYTNSYGFLTSPSYPSNYGNNQNCSNIVWAPRQSTFYFHFQQFETESDCSRDWLEISCLDNSEYGQYRFCGNYDLYEMYVYRCSQVLLWFHSDDTNNYQGFNIEYSITNDDCGNTSYYGPSGVIHSPNYPENYINLLNCSYYIYASEESTVSLVFEAFRTYGTEDIVTISCPSDPSFPPQQYFGDPLPDPISIPRCSLALVHFRTDDKSESDGFSLTYTVTVEDDSKVPRNGKPNAAENAPSNGKPK